LYQATEQGSGRGRIQSAAAQELLNGRKMDGKKIDPYGESNIPAIHFPARSAAKRLAINFTCEAQRR